MKLKLLSLLFLSFLIAGLSVNEAYGQLLEDRNKLKTEKATKKGFSLYKKKVIKRSPSGQTQTDDKTVSPKYSRKEDKAKTDRRISPRYSRKGREKGIRSITPRYSQDNAGNVSGRVVSPKYSRQKKAGKVRIISPKYSIDVAGQGSDRGVSPKYSQDIAGKGTDRIVQPKYSRSIAGKGSDRYVSPKYSRQMAGQGADRVVNPKYSRSIAGKGSDRYVSPKYSRDVAGQGSDRIVSPKYSRDIAGRGSDRYVNPKYSRDVAGQGADRVVNPRYSRYTAGSGSDRAVNPRYSVSPLYFYKYKLPNSASGSMVFEFPRKQHLKNRKRNTGESEWDGPAIAIIDHKRPEFSGYVGDYKIKTGIIENYKGRSEKKKLSAYTGKYQKHRKGKKMHPSANYLYAKYNNSRIARDAMQKASVLWVRVHMNQTDPKGVKKKTSKLKFDKDETEIWNNEPREYTKN